MYVKNAKSVHARPINVSFCEVGSRYEVVRRVVGSSNNNLFRRGGSAVMAVAGKAKIDSLGRQRKKLRAETWPLVSPNRAGGRAARRLIVTGGAAIICYRTVLYLAWGTRSTWGRVLCTLPYDTRNSRSRAGVGEPMLRQTRITQHYCWPGEVLNLPYHSYSAPSTVASLCYAVRRGLKGTDHWHALPYLYEGTLLPPYLRTAPQVPRTLSSVLLS